MKPGKMKTRSYSKMLCVLLRLRYVRGFSVCFR